MRAALCVLFLSGAVTAYGDLVSEDKQSKEITAGEQTIPTIDRLIATGTLPNSEAKGFLNEFVLKYDEWGPKLDLNQGDGHWPGSDIFDGKGQGQLHKHHDPEDPPPPVPEPTSIATFGSGALILAFYTRRRWRNSRP